MDGIETARQIRKRIGKEITIIVLTSYEFSEIEEEAKAAGIDAFIAKPLFRSRICLAVSIPSISGIFQSKITAK